MRKTEFIAVSALALTLSAPAFAQDAFSEVQAVDDRITDIQGGVSDDFARSNDAERYQSAAYNQGWDGSVALGYTTTSGNTDTTDLDVAARFHYGKGAWDHTFGLAIEYSEESGAASREAIFGTYDVNRYFTDSFYAFGMASINQDSFASNERSGFVGVGPGFRLINTPDHTWRVQLGAGMRYTLDADGLETNKTAGVAASRYYRRLSDTIFLTDDTDILFDGEDVSVSNDLGVNFQISDTMSTRISYRTEWEQNPLPGLENADNTFGVSLVIGF